MSTYFKTGSCIAILSEEYPDLFGNFVNWCISQNLPNMVKSVFGKALSNLGYETHRDNVPGGSGRKATFVLNVAIKKDELEQPTVKSGQANGQAGEICLSYGTDSEKTDIGQATIPFVENYLRNEKEPLKENCMVSVGDIQFREANLPPNEEEKKIFSNNKEFACPNQRFFDSGIYGQANSANSEFACPKSKITLSNQEKFPDSDPCESVEYLTKLNFLKNEIKTFHSTWLRNHGGIDDLSTFCGAFAKACPGFPQTFPKDVIISEIEKVCKRIQTEGANVSGSDQESGEVESTIEG